MNPKIAVATILAIIAIGMGYLFIQGTNETNTNINSDTESAQQNNTDDSDASNLVATYPHLRGANIGDEVNAEDEPEVTIDIDDNIFETTVLTISKGTKVTWVNKGNVGHNVQADNDSDITIPTSDLMRNGESYSFVFNEEGTFRYICSPHPVQMRGIIVVK